MIVLECGRSIRQKMKKILIVDDDESILLLYTEILGKAGYEVHSSEDGASAIIKYQMIKPDLVLLDFEIPAGGGLGVLKGLRGALAQAVPVLFVTGHTEAEIGVALKFYRVGYLKKPFTRDDLLTKVRETFENIPQSAPQAESLPPQSTDPPR